MVLHLVVNCFVESLSPSFEVYVQIICTSQTKRRINEYFD
uniref:Uncharacterized protein n=1 Tax=Rhizophora mucronata TaxID=61149 RepID=A0A2P2PDP4_RHIMU